MCEFSGIGAVAVQAQRVGAQRYRFARSSNHMAIADDHPHLRQRFIDFVNHRTGHVAWREPAIGFVAAFGEHFVGHAQSDPFTSGGTVSVYDGLGGTGTLLASTVLGLTSPGPCPGYTGAYCPFVADGLSFSGTAKSIVFGGVANQVVFDDITFGSATPGGVPEPETWALLLLGAAGIGAAARQRRDKAPA